MIKEPSSPLQKASCADDDDEDEDDDDEEAADMEAFEESGMLEQEDPVCS